MSSIMRRSISLLLAPGKVTRPVKSSKRQQPMDLRVHRVVSRIETDIGTYLPIYPHMDPPRPPTHHRSTARSYSKPRMISGAR